MDTCNECHCLISSIKHQQWGQSYKNCYTLGEIYKHVMKNNNNALTILLVAIILGSYTLKYLILEDKF